MKIWYKKELQKEETQVKGGQPKMELLEKEKKK